MVNKHQRLLLHLLQQRLLLHLLQQRHLNHKKNKLDHHLNLKQPMNHNNSNKVDRSNQVNNLLHLK